MANIDVVPDNHETGEVYEPTTTDLTVVSSEINMQVATAHRFPRRKDKVIALEIMSRTTLNEEIAAECIYNLKRGKGDDTKEIIGPSIRFAEIVRASYGNIRVASRFVRVDKDDPLRQAVIVEAIAMDMQQNDAEIIQVRRSIMTSPKQGQPRPYNADMTNMTVNAGQSIARRNAILALVPKALWVDGYHGALNVVRGSAVTLNERRAKMITAFGTFGVKPQDLFEALGVDSEQEITLNDMPGLAGMWTALKEGESVAVVLGRAREDSGAPAPKPAIKSPLQDNEPGQAADQTVAKEQHAQEAAQKTAQEARTEAQTSPATGQRSAQENAQETAPKPEKEPSGPEAGSASAAAYLQEGLAIIANAVSETALKEWWKRTRSEREKVLTTKQVSDLTDVKDDKLNHLATVR